MLGLSVFLLELAGAILLASYNGPLANMKKIGIGEFEVSLIWGPLLVLGGFAASARGMLTVQVLLVSLLPGMMMMSLIYANNYREIVSDSRAGVRSFAYRTQKHGDLIYNLCLFAPYALDIDSREGTLFTIYNLLLIAAVLI